MKSSRSIVLLMSAPMLALPLVCLAQEDPPTRPEFTIGIKAWDTYWQSYLPSVVSGVTSGGAPILGEVVNSVEGNKKVEALPTFTVRYDRYFLSAGYARYSTDFNVSQSPVVTPDFTTTITSRRDHISRREVDINAGYFVLPGLALTLGYKTGRENRETSTGLSPVSVGSLDSKLDVWLVGALGSYEIQNGFSAYGQFGYGVGRIRSTFGPGLAPFTGREIRSHAKYIVSEVGLAYRLPIEPSWLRRTSIALGYRSQTIKESVPSVVSGETRDLRDVKDGFVLSLNATF